MWDRVSRRNLRDEGWATGNSQRGNWERNLVVTKLLSSSSKRKIDKEGGDVDFTQERTAAMGIGEILKRRTKTSEKGGARHGGNVSLLLEVEVLYSATSFAERGEQKNNNLFIRKEKRVQDRGGIHPTSMRQ